MSDRRMSAATGVSLRASFHAFFFLFSHFIQSNKVPKKAQFGMISLYHSKHAGVEEGAVDEEKQSQKRGVAGGTRVSKHEQE